MHDPVITGIGLVTCLGPDAAQTWSRLECGGRGVVPLPADVLPGCRTNFAGVVRDFAPPAGHETADRAVQFAVAAAHEACAAAAFNTDETRRLGRRAAVVFGSSKGSVLSFAALHERWLRATRSNRRADATAELANFWRVVPPDVTASTVAQDCGMTGPTTTPVAACATGTHAVIQASEWIRSGRADVVLCGAADASIHLLWIAAFEQMDVLAVPHSRDGVAGACRPFDKDRCGFAVSEGAAALIVESRSSAHGRGVPILATVAGGAIGSDPSSLAGIDSEAACLCDVAQLALTRAGLAPTQIDALNAHATGTLVNDAAETTAWRRLAAEHAAACPVTAFKGALGHSLGAAGAIELALCAEMLRRQTILPTANHAEPGPDTRGLSIHTVAQARPVRAVLKTSLGFGGHVAAVVLRRE